MGERNCILFELQYVDGETKKPLNNNRNSNSLFLQSFLYAQHHVHACVIICFSRVQIFATPWTVACQAPLSKGFSRQEYWSGLPFPTLGHLPDPGIKPGSPALHVDSLPSELPGKPLEGAPKNCEP